MEFEISVILPPWSKITLFIFLFSKNNLLKFKNLLSDLEVTTIEKLLGKHLYFKQ